MTSPISQENSSRPLRVLYFGTYRAEYSRNQILIEGLRRCGIKVSECHAALWKGVEDRVRLASGGWANPLFWLRILRVYPVLFFRALFAAEFDVLAVGYPGQFDIFLAWVISRIRRRPLVWDVFMSIYLIALERGLDRRSSFTVKMLYRFEKMAFRLPDMLIQDTHEYVAWLCRTYHMREDQFRLVPTGADDRVFYPRAPMKNKTGRVEVLYYGTFIPNHGVKVMVEAAKLLADDEEIHFTFIGTGPDLEVVKEISLRAGLKNITFIDWLEKNALPEKIARADICLGAFGDTPQSLMTVQNKIYECLAMRKAVIVGDSPAIRQAFSHQEQVFICERDPRSLADAVMSLRDDPGLCEKMAGQGYALYQARYRVDRLGESYAGHLREAQLKHPQNRGFIHR